MGNLRTSDRRAEPDRRQPNDRRRPSEAKRAVFELCRSTLNMALVTGGADSEKLITRTLRWRTSATSLHTARGVQELTDAFRTLVVDERLAGAKVRVTLGGEYCVTRIVTGPNEEVRKEFSELEERSHRYLTLGPGRKALSRTFQPLDARHQFAMLTVTSQRTLDLLLQIAASVGVSIESIEPSLIALSRAQASLRDPCTDACILIQVDEAAAELGICHRGRLLLDYRPGGNTGTANIASVVGQHLFRLQRYLKRYHSYIDKPLKNVYLTGDPEAVERVRKKFSEMRELDVRVLDPLELACEWQHVGSPPGTQLAAALGTALAFIQDEDQTPGPNLLEGALAQLKTPLRPTLLRSLLPLAAAVFVAATIFALHLINVRHIAGLRSELLALQPAQTRATELRLQLVAAGAKLSQLEALQHRLTPPDWDGFLLRLAQSMPPDVWLDRVIVLDGSSATLGGASFTDSGVYDFVNYLKLVPDVAEIALEGTGAGRNETGPTTTFDLKATLAKFEAGARQENHNE